MVRNIESDPDQLCYPLQVLSDELELIDRITGIIGDVDLDVIAGGEVQAVW